jgi:hypothetical protein
VDAKRFDSLERELRGGEVPDLFPERAAYELSKTAKGRRLLERVLRSRSPVRVRFAAAYGFCYAQRLTISQRELLLRVFERRNEAPIIRGQAAESLGPRLYSGTGKAVRTQFARRAREAFVRGLDDPAPEVRLWSIFALAQPCNAWLIPRLEQMRGDSAMVPGMWRVGQEAGWAISWIRYQDLSLDPRDF